MSNENGSELMTSDFLTTSVSIFFTSISDIPTLLVSLWPQIALLSSFAFFVYWNGGVVLGKSV